MVGGMTIGLRESLLSPGPTLRRLDASGPGSTRLPYRVWAALVAVAVLGSCLYGASLSLVLPRWRPWAGARWVALSAGLAWCVFGPGLMLLTRRHPLTLAHACLVTMAYGEAVLALGAGLNLLLRASGLSRRVPAGPFNLAWVGLSNVVMAATLARQLGGLGVPARTTLAAWFGLLDGSGAVLFWLFGRPSPPPPAARVPGLPHARERSKIASPEP